MSVTFFVPAERHYLNRIEGHMFDDVFDRNWELAILIREQYQAVYCRDRRAIRIRSRRIEELLRNVRRELPNWQEDAASSVTFCAN